MTFNTPPDLQPGDVVETATEIRRNDIVCWERVGKNKLIMRTLSPQEATTYKGRKFIVDRSDESGSIQYVEIEFVVAAQTNYWIVSSKHSRDQATSDWNSKKWTVDHFLRSKRFFPSKRKQDFSVGDRCLLKVYGKQEFIADFIIASALEQDTEGGI